MKQQVNPFVALLAILCVVGVAGYYFWKENQDAPIPERATAGRIANTLNLGKTQEQMDAEKKAKAAKAKAGKPKTADSTTTPRPSK